ncbi:hypothetical protein D3C78_1457680 [compost metagenome]
MPRRLHHFQDLAQAVGLDPARDQRIGQQGLGFGTEDHAVGRLVVVERLNSHAVADQQQLLRSHVPDGKGVHAVEPFDKAGTPFDVGAQHYLRVAASLETMPTGFQFATQFAEVVDLAAIGDGRHLASISLAGRHGLASTLEVDDRQSTMAQPDRAFYPDTSCIRAP